MDSELTNGGESAAPAAPAWSHLILRRPDGGGLAVVPIHAGRALKPKDAAWLRG